MFDLEMYTENEPDRPDRPKTSRGYRERATPARPVSRHSRKENTEEESSGRPVSRVGFSPESAYRYDCFVIVYYNYTSMRLILHT